MKTSAWTLATIFSKAVIPLLALIAVLCTLAGCEGPRAYSSSTAKSYQALSTLIQRQHASPWVEINYNDISSSRSRLGAHGSWSAIKTRVEQFLETAPPGSKLEVWVTGRVAGQPDLAFEVKGERLRPLLRRQKKQRTLQQLEAVERRISSQRSNVPYSCVLEDSHRCALRALNIGQQGARSKVVIYSDLQQFSPNLKLSEILRGDNKGLGDRVLRFMPQLSAPLDWLIIYYPGISGPQALSSAQELKLREFFRYITGRWGSATCEVIEPQSLDPTPSSMPAGAVHK